MGGGADGAHCFDHTGLHRARVSLVSASTGSWSVWQAWIATKLPSAVETIASSCCSSCHESNDQMGMREFLAALVRSQARAVPASLSRGLRSVIFNVALMAFSHRRVQEQ